jgi:K+-transporting ATPase ATPase A chain
MAGLGSNTLFYNTTQAVSMLVGRFMLIIPVLAIAGSLARKHPVPDTAGTFRTDTPLFVSLLLGMILVVAGLTYFPVLSLGPVIETLRT